MLLYNRRNAVSVDFNRNPQEIDNFGDVVLDFIEHMSYVDDIQHLKVDFLEDGQHITECDYCGEQILRDWKNQESKGGRGQVLESYVDKESEYPCTDDCCRKCTWKKRAIFNYSNYGTIKDVKGMETRARNGKVPTSRQQIYLSNLLNGQLNKYFKGVGFVDMVLEDKRIVLEYDGSGHFLGIAFGKYTYQEKLLQDYERDMILKKLGYRVIRMHSLYDYLPYDEVIVAEIDRIENHFDATGEDFMKIQIPSSKKNKRYGDLREIKQKDLNG